MVLNNRVSEGIDHNAIATKSPNDLSAPLTSCPCRDRAGDARFSRTQELLKGVYTGRSSRQKVGAIVAAIAAAIVAATIAATIASCITQAIVAATIASWLLD